MRTRLLEEIFQIMKDNAFNKIVQSLKREEGVKHLFGASTVRLINQQREEKQKVNG